MAVVTAMPSEAIISGFKGTIDFYYWMGLACVRAWPRSPGHKRAPAVEAGWPAFAYASREWVNLSLSFRTAYDSYSGGSGLSGRDLAMRAYLKGLYRNPLP